MPHVIEHATSGRAKCRGCEQKIDKGELRFGEREPNIFGEGEMTLWFHLWCGAYKRPEPFLEALNDAGDTGENEARGDIPGEKNLRAAAELGMEHRRLPRVNGASRAPTGRARCRHCRELIGKGTWRIALVFFEEYRFQPSGFIHAGCATGYLGTTDVMKRVRHFDPELEPAELDELKASLNNTPVK